MSKKYSDSSDSYTDPESGILRNKLGLKSEGDLERAEAAASALRAQELAIRPVNGKFDLKHLQQIHGRLFSDVYKWAGEIRTVDITKAETRFAHSGYIASETQKLTSQLEKESHLKGLPPERFSERAAHYMGELNVVHPFREGNGRSLRVFIGQIAKQAGYEIKWEGIERKDMTRASIEAYQSSSDRLASLIRGNLVDRDREKALQLAGATKAKEPEAGQAYTGKILSVTDRYVAQSVGNGEIVLHQKQALSGLQKITDGKSVGIEYPAGRAGVVRELATPEKSNAREAGHEKKREAGERER